MQPNTKVSEKVLFPELSYKVTGLLFEIHNSLGRYCKEKQYAEALEQLLKESNLSYVRENPLPLEKVSNRFTNKADFVINDQILVELKAKPLISKLDYIQTQRYLVAGGLKLGIIVNFRNRHLKPIRVIRSNS